MTTTETHEIGSHVDALDWPRIQETLYGLGCAVAPAVLSPQQCRSLVALYEQDELYRSRITMARHSFGRGEYKYWNYPLPETVAALRTALYPHLAGVAIFGRRIVTARQVAWYGDHDYSYTYSGTTKTALGWSRELLAIKAVVETHSQERFNSCLLNLYGDGSEGMGWHSDDEKSLGRDTAIASVSFGAERKFALKHKRETLAAAVVLEHGSLLVMKGATQTHWLHSVPKAKRITSARVNLTFRTMIIGKHAGRVPRTV